MARTQVQSELLATNSISGTIIADNAITATHIATNAISGTLIQDSGIVTTMIAANNITATKVVTNAIQTRHIADDQVTEDKLANAINTSIAAKLPLAGGTMTGNIVMGDDTSIGIADDAERIEFDGAGDISLLGANVGIGTTSPSDKLHVALDSSTTNAEVDVVRIEATSSGTPAVGFGPFIDFRGDRINGGADSYGRLGFEADAMPSTTVDGAFVVQTSEDGTYSERLRIASDGKVGIGTPTTNKIFNIADPAQGGETLKLHFEAESSADKWAIYSYDRTNGHYADLSFGGNYLYLKSGGNVGIGNSNPQHPFIVHLTDGEVAMFGSNGMNDTGKYAGIGLGQVIANGTGYQKIKIVAEGRSSGSYVSNLHFLVDTAADPNSAVLSDSKMMISGNNGEVGIGTTSPARQLHVKSTGTNMASFEGSNGEGVVIVNNTNGRADIIGYSDTASAYNKVVLRAQGSTDQLVLETNGSLATYNNFYVSGEGSGLNNSGNQNGNYIASNGTSFSSRAASNLQTHKSFLNTNGTVGSIQTQNSGTLFNTSSDYRLKENVVTDWDGTTLLKQLKPSKFNFKANPDITVQGFLAHEVSSIVPEAVSGAKDDVYTAEDETDGLGTEGQPKYQGIDHSKLVPLLVKTIQELEARIATLEG